MKLLSRWIPDLFLGALALGLVVLLALPWGQRRTPGSSGEEGPASLAVAAEPAGTAGRTTSPRELAVLFGWREPKAAPAAKPGPAAPQAQEAPWIQAMGYVVEQNGTRSYIFKDLRTRAVLSLKQGTVNKGWRLLEVRERDFLLEFDGQPYIIKRKP
jgi:hypothetical protein